MRISCKLAGAENEHTNPVNGYLTNVNAVLTRRPVSPGRHRHKTGPLGRMFIYATANDVKMLLADYMLRGLPVEQGTGFVIQKHAWTLDRDCSYLRPEPLRGPSTP